MNKKTQSTLFIIIGIIIFIIILILSTGSKKEPKATAEPTTISESQKVVFDVPALIGKSIDDIEAIYGEESSQEPTPEQIQLSSEWSKEFTRNTYHLGVTYDHKIRMVKDLFVSAPDAIYESRDKEFMMQITNTEGGANTYTISFVPALKDTTRFTGILITPKI